MKSQFLQAASAFALVSQAAPAAAQMNMPGMTMPIPAKPAVKKKPVANSKRSTPPARKKGIKAPASKPPAAIHPTPSATQSMAPMSSIPTDHGAMPMPQPQAPSGPTTPMDHQHAGLGQMNMPSSGHASHGMDMTGALGAYPMERESSGTSWQPDATGHRGLMKTSGSWMLMTHGVLNLVYDHQWGARGDDQAFASGMLMGMARRPLGDGTLQFKAMVSPDPAMGPRGYPLLLASGETANGRDRLTDRQHPHDFFMELSASASQNLGRNSSVFLYAGLPGEPAFGPPAFQHRESIWDSPEAPITHHWLDSTHISFGVLTGGLVVGRAKLEISRFNGREPDQHRWNIETAPLDSTSVRLSWNPTASLALEGSWGHFVDPEQLEPGVDQRRLSMSALYAREIAPGWKLATTLAWGRKSAQGNHDDAFAAEASIKQDRWSLFGRGEITENRELIDLEDGPAYQVGKISIGAVRDFRLAEHFNLGAGGLVALNFVPDALAPSYGGHNPVGMMGFVRLTVD